MKDNYLGLLHMVSNAGEKSIATLFKSSNAGVLKLGGLRIPSCSLKITGDTKELLLICVDLC